LGALWPGWEKRHVYSSCKAPDPQQAHHGRCRSSSPPHLAGFPWHPHRGIETITYVLAGTVDHADSIGNRGAIAPGDVQWMTAGSGIIHQEMPKGDHAGRMHGFQLWANLPANLKMTRPATRK